MTPGPGISETRGERSLGDPGPAGKRVRIVSPRRDARRRSEKRPDAVELTEQTGLGEIYLTALLRAQLRLSMATLLAVGGVLVGLPALFLLVPGVAAATVGPVPMIWLVAGVGTYPLILLAARIHVYLAERIERDFTDLMTGR
jgi:uncharacterized membrane protein